MPGSTVEDYLKRIYIEQQQRGDDVLIPMGRLATAMDVVPGTVTAMVKVLAKSGLVEYEPRNGTRLTERDLRLAPHVLRRHRLVEMFLVEAFKLDWSEVHEEAEKLEHVVSDKVLDRIDEFLGHPREDPHGDPIPSVGGAVTKVVRDSLAECELGGTLRITRILDQAPAFLQFVDRHGLIPGADLVVDQRDSAADAVTLTPNGRQSVTVGTAVARKILVKPL